MAPAQNPVALRHVQIMAAAAAQWNNELTVLLSDIQDLVRSSAPEDPARPAYLEMRSSLQRCAWLASGMLNYAVRKGARRPLACHPERLMEQDRLSRD